MKNCLCMSTEVAFVESEGEAADRTEGDGDAGTGSDRVTIES